MFKVGYSFYNRLENKNDNQIRKIISKIFAEINIA